MDLLPATVYQSPPRQARGRLLNTILEEGEDGGVGMRSDSDGSGSDRTIVGKPAGWDSRLFVAGARKASRLATTTFVAASPVSPFETSPCSSAGEGSLRNSGRSSYQGSENGTVFSDDSCPSLASDPTTFATDTDSSRNSVASSKSGRNRYPALLIPRISWNSVDSPIKEIALGMSPASKIRLDPSVLSRLPRAVPDQTAPPSLGSSSSVASDSPCIASTSGPVTPDMRQLEVSEGDAWGVPEQSHTDQPLEIALDEDHSILLSPAEAHEPRSATFSSFMSPREREWGDIVVRFPLVPGATPQLDSSQFGLGFGGVVEPPSPSEEGLFLPSDALQTLARLTRQRSPDERSESSRLLRMQQEMRERSEPSPGSRPRSLDGATPLSDHSYSKLSDYSFTQLSIPSPGGFFSSLQAGARHTWCLNGSRTNSVPTSATAERFYNAAWSTPGEIKETVIVADEEDTNYTEGPPTARQAVFLIPDAANDVSVIEPNEDQDLYGPGDDDKNLVPHVRHEYEEAYEEEIKQAAEANIDRTGSWLAAQTSYLSALRETNPANDPVDFLPSPHPFLSRENSTRNHSIDSNIRKTVHFLEGGQPEKSQGLAICENSPESEDGHKELIFHAAFEHLMHHGRRRDAFLQASSRLEAIRSSRIALPAKHINSLLGQHQLVSPKRPKYSGPFNQNPRATGIFERTKEQLTFEKVEREQQALESVQSSTWQVEALRAIFNGRLLASPSACERLRRKATVPLNDPSCVGSKRVRILDFGGESAASWAWHAAHEWPNVKVYTVLSKEQARTQRPAGEPKPAGPPNHRTVSVPHLWQLPFRSNHFDVVSARGLYALLKNNPVPGVPEIDEWDLTLRECMRVLKKGGYLDYMIMDSTMARAGPRGEALSVEFGFELHRRGYEREAARGWLRRLKKEGFVGVKRAWIFLPMGRKDVQKEWEEKGVGGGDFHAFRNGKTEFLAAPRPVSEVSTISKIVKQYMDVEAVQGPIGSTQDVADITGLLGARMWEEWLVKVRTESGREANRLLEGIDEVIEEGKANGSGWKVLVGWARKPRPTTPTTRMTLNRADIRIALAGDESCAGSEMASPADETRETGMIPMMIQN